MSVSDANALKLNYQKKLLKSICRKASQLEKIKERKPLFWKLSVLRTTGVWMPTLATDTHHALCSNTAFVASWCTMPA